MLDRRLLTHFDWPTFAVTLSLTVIGLFTIYSATYTRLPMFYRREGYWIIIGITLLIVAVILNYNLLERFAYVIYGSSVALLVAVLFLGSSMGGARRWLNLGLFNIQPSELAKLALIIILARYFSERELPAKGLGIKELLVPGLFLLVPFALIARQPDLGTAVILWMIFCSVLLAVKVRKRTILGLLVIFGAFFPFAWKGLKGYQKARLLSFIDPDVDPLGTGYHLMQSKIAIGSGGFFGRGFTKGTQGKLMFLPEHHTDFIFSVLAEEWGLVGSFVVVSLFLTLVLRGLGTAGSSKDRFGFLLAFGISAMFFWHIIINLGMVSGLLPVVGVPLPFISYGGSFLVTSLIAVGILISIKMRRFIF